MCFIYVDRWDQALNFIFRRWSERLTYNFVMINYIDFHRAVLNIFSRNVKTAVDNFQECGRKSKLGISVLQCPHSSDELTWLSVTVWAHNFFWTIYILLISNFLYYSAPVSFGFTSLGSTASRWLAFHQLQCNSKFDPCFSKCSVLFVQLRIWYRYDVLHVEERLRTQFHKVRKQQHLHF